MTLTKERKQEIISEFQVHETDTGSSDLQVAVLTARIERLSQHMQQHKKDYASRRGLMKLIGQRKRLLKYIRRQGPQHYQQLIQRLGIRG